MNTNLNTDLNTIEPSNAPPIKKPARMTIWAVLLVIAVAFVVIGAGCTNQTEGQQTLTKASRIENAGNMIRRGEINVEDGKGMQARGQALKDQGSNPAGDSLIAEGRAKQKYGEELQNQGRELRDKN